MVVVNKETRLKLQPMYFKVHIYVLKCMGLNIIPTKFSFLNFIYSIYGYSFIISVFVYTAIESLSTVIASEGMNDFTLMLCYNIAHVTGCVKIFLFIIKKETVWNYLQSIESGVFKPDYDRGGNKEVEIIKRTIWLVDIQAYIWHAFCAAVLILRAIFIAMDPGYYVDIKDDVTNLTTSKYIKILPLCQWFPIDQNESPVYEFSFAYQILAPFFLGAYMVSVDLIICGIMMHIKAQYRILIVSLGNILRRVEKRVREDMKENGNEVSSDDLDDIVEKRVEKLEVLDEIHQKHLRVLVKDCIIHHHKILKLSERMEQEFSSFLLFQVIGNLLICCFQQYQLSLYDPMSVEFASMVVFVILMLLQLFYYCWHGNEASMISDELTTYVYKMPWIIFDEENKHHLRLMMTRTYRPFKFSAAKLIFLNLESFMRVVKGSVSFYMFLKKM